MKKQSYIALIVCTITSICIVYFLFYLSEINANVNNGFLRKVNIPILKQSGKVDLRFNSYYIAGFSNDSIYLGNSVAPDCLLIADRNLTHIHLSQFKINSSKKITWGSMKLSINYPCFFLTEGSTPVQFKGKFPQLAVTEVNIGSTIFDKPKVLNNGSTIFRTNEPKLKQNILMKRSKDEKEPKRFVLKKQTEGYFSTDGSLIFDRKSNKLVYVYFYQNDFTILDTNLNVLKNSKTIDTVTTVKIHLASIKSLGTTTMIEPPKMINYNCTVDNDLLFVCSKLRSDNEDKSIFKSNFVIDVYSLINGGYLYSFYLPKFGYKNISSIEVDQNEIFVLYDNFLYKFNLPK